jgi:SM-20-related protein
MVQFDVLTIPDLLDAETCSRIIDEVRESPGKRAPVYGKTTEGSVDDHVRQVTRADVSETLTDLIIERLNSIIPWLSAHYNVDLTELEPPQFLHYRQGDHFVAHQDGNTPLIHDDTRFRKVSVVIFLNAQTETENAGFRGGSLVLQGSYPNYSARHTIPPVAGSLAAFRSEVTHEVTPIEAGERFTVVSWYLSA